VRTRFRFMAWRRLFLSLSGALLVLTGLSLATRGLNFGIDFTGGVVMDVSTPRPTSVAAVRRVLATVGQGQAEIQVVTPVGVAPQSPNAATHFEFRLPPVPDRVRAAILAALRRRFGPRVTEDSVDEVTPVIGQELRTRALVAVLVATALMTAYLALRFEFGEAGSYSGLKFALAAVIALLHDITLTVGLFSVLHLQVNSPFVAAVLTVYGYSMNDTIIVFDRIRERMKSHRREPLSETIDISINQVLSRTVTTVATVILALLAVYFLGGASTRSLALALLVGVCFGTYSSVFVASPIYLWLMGERRGAGRARAVAEPAR
jgi:preprotein translocase subunit SecF